MRCKAMAHAGRIKIVITQPQLLFGTNYTVNVLPELKRFEPTIGS